MQLNKLTDEQLAVIVREENKEIYSEIIRRYESKLAHYLRKFIYDKDESTITLKLADRGSKLIFYTGQTKIIYF